MFISKQEVRGERRVEGNRQTKGGPKKKLTKVIRDDMKAYRVDKVRDSDREGCRKNIRVADPGTKSKIKKIVFLRFKSISDH